MPDGLVEAAFNWVIFLTLIALASLIVMIIVGIFVSLIRKGGKARATIQYASMTEAERIAADARDMRILREAEEALSDDKDRPESG